MLFRSVLKPTELGNGNIYPQRCLSREPIDHAAQTHFNYQCHRSYPYIHIKKTRCFCSLLEETRCMSSTSPLNCDMISWNDCGWLMDDCTTTVGKMINGEHCIKWVSKVLFLFYDKNWVHTGWRCHHHGRRRLRR